MLGGLINFEEFKMKIADVRRTRAARSNRTRSEYTRGNLDVANVAERMRENRPRRFGYVEI